MLKIYGTSDDLIEIEGQMEDEINIYDCGLKIEFTDGTIVQFDYSSDGIWECVAINKGDKFDYIEEHDPMDEDNYSDILYMKDSEECLIKSFEEV